MVNLVPWLRRRGEHGDAGSLLDLRSEMDRLFDHFFEGSGFGMQPASGMTSMWSPALEMFEENNNLVISAEVPGMSPEDIEINVSGHELTISGEKKEESEQKRAGAPGIFHSERRYGRFFRSIELPPDVDTENIAAEYDHGVLTLRLPRTQEHQPRRIQVKPGGGRKQVGSKSAQPGRQDNAKGHASTGGETMRSDARHRAGSTNPATPATRGGNGA